MLVRELATELDAPTARLVLRNPHAGEEVVRLLVDQSRLLVFYEVRRDLAQHPATPQPIALTMVSTLFWRDLMAVGLDVRIPPVVRRAAEQHLVERLPGLAGGGEATPGRRGGARGGAAGAGGPPPPRP